jgi:hypothetical protein
VDLCFARNKFVDLVGRYTKLQKKGKAKGRWEEKLSICGNYLVLPVLQYQLRIKAAWEFLEETAMGI